MEEWAAILAEQVDDRVQLFRDRVAILVKLKEVVPEPTAKGQAEFDVYRNEREKQYQENCDRYAAECAAEREEHQEIEVKILTEDDLDDDSASCLL